MQVRITYLFFYYDNNLRTVIFIWNLKCYHSLKFSVVLLDFRRFCGWYGTADNFSWNFFLLFSFSWHKNFRFSSLGKFWVLVFINKITFYIQGNHLLRENTWDYIHMRRVHAVYWTIKLWNGVTFRRGQAICNWAYLLYLFCFAKQPLSISSKQSFSEILIYFQK